MTKLGRPRAAIKRITISAHIKQDTFALLIKKSKKRKISLSRLIANILEAHEDFEKEI